MLAAWWFVDLLIDQLEHRRGLTGSWLGGAGFILLLCLPTSAEVFQIATVAIGLGLAYRTIYWVRIRRCR